MEYEKIQIDNNIRLKRTDFLPYIGLKNYIRRNPPGVNYSIRQAVKATCTEIFLYGFNILPLAGLGYGAYKGLEAIMK